MTENQQLLKDPSVEPNDKILAEVLGAAYEFYSKFIEQLPTQQIEFHWQYYRDGNVWFGKGLYKNKTIFWLSIWPAYFKVTFYFAGRLRADMQNLSLSATTKKQIASAPQPGKSKIFAVIFDVKSETDFADMLTLIAYKKTAK